MANLKVRFNSTSKRNNDVIQFGGLDLSSPKLNVASNHCLDEMNYVFRDGSVQKRFGYNKNLPSFKNVSSVGFYYYPVSFYNNVDSASTSLPTYDNTLKVVSKDDPIYDMWVLKDLIIVHKGSALFYLKTSSIIDEDDYELTPIAINRRATGVTIEGGTIVYPYFTYEMPERKMSGYVGNSKLWILTGTNFISLELRDNDRVIMRSVQNNAYVPTTTIGIMQSESNIGGNRLTFESANMLTTLRKNGIVGGIKNADDSNVGTFALDANIKNISNFKVEIESPYKYYSNNRTSPNLTFLNNKSKVFAYPCLGKTNVLHIPRDKLVRGDFDIKNFVFRFNRAPLYPKLTPHLLKDANVPELTPTQLGDPYAIPDVSKVDEYENDCYYATLYINGNKIDPDTDYGWSHEVISTAVALDQNNMDIRLIFHCKMDNDLYSSEVKINDYEETYFAPNAPTIELHRTFGLSTSQLNNIAVTDLDDYVGNYYVVTNGYTVPIFGGECAVIAVYGILGFPTSFTDFTVKVRDSGDRFAISDHVTTYEVTGNKATAHAEYDGSKLTLRAVRATSNDRLVSWNQLSWYPLGRIDYPYSENQEGYFLVSEYDELGNEDLYFGRPIILGYINAKSGESNLGHDITLFYYPGGSIAGDSNIVVTFNAVTDKDYATYINKCRFGCLFGTSNAKNRLFVSGNPDFPNVDWHSSESEEEGEFNYFPDNSYCTYGQDSNAVVGYSIISDGKLLVLKNYSDKESSVYYRTSTYTTLKDDYGNSITFNNTTLLVESFPLIITNSKIAGRASHLCCNFNGDSIFVATNGEIVGLDNNGTTYDNQRIASSRSTLIDKAIKNIEKPEEKCLLVEDGDELFYFTPKCSFYTNFKVSYEWFKIDMTNISSFCHYNSPDSNFQLFGDDVGNVYLFKPGEFSDMTRYFASIGEVAMAEDRHTEFIYGGYPVLSPDMKTLYEEGFNYFYVNDVTFNVIAEAVEENYSRTLIDNGRLFIAFPKDLVLPEETYKVRLYLRDGSIGFEYEGVLQQANIEDLEELSLPYTDSFIWYNVGTYTASDIPFEIQVTKRVLKKTIKFTIDEQNRVVFELNGKLMAYGLDLASTPSGDADLNDNIDDYSNNLRYITKESPVVAYYITAPYLSSALNYRKVIDSYAIVADTDEPNEIYVKVATNNTSLDEITYERRESVGRQVNYNDYTMRKIDYMRYELPHVQILGAKFYGTFISLRLYSPNPTNSTLTQLQFTYHVAKQAYGRN